MQGSSPSSELHIQADVTPTASQADLVGLSASEEDTANRKMTACVPGQGLKPRAGWECSWPEPGRGAERPSGQYRLSQHETGQRPRLQVS